MFEIVNYQKNNFLLTNDFDKINRDAVCYLLSQTYWAANRDKDVIIRSLENSLCFGLFYKDKQIGFLRIISDYTTFAYLTDVVIDEDFRFEGLGSWCIECVLAHPELKDINRWLLITKDANNFYKNFGFNYLRFPDTFMELLNI